MTSSGVLKPNGAGFPIFNFKIFVPSRSIRFASSTTGPRTSYKTLSSLLDLLKWRTGGFLLSVREERSISGSKKSSLEASPRSHSSSTSNVSARKWAISARGRVFPLTYWLIWLFPTFNPAWSAACTRSTCFICFCSIAERKCSANSSFWFIIQLLY